MLQVILDREEDAKDVCRLDQLAEHADGLRNRAVVVAVFPPFFLRGCLA